MTTENQNQKKTYYAVYKQYSSGEKERVGAIFMHKKGNGFNIVIGENRYVVFEAEMNSKEDVIEHKELNGYTICKLMKALAIHEEERGSA